MICSFLLHGFEKAISWINVPHTFECLDSFHCSFSSLDWWDCFSLESFWKIISYWVYPVCQIYAKVIEYILYSKFMPKLLSTSYIPNLCQSYWVHPVCQIYAKVIGYILYAKFMPKLLSTSCMPNLFQSYWVHPVSQIHTKVIEYILYAKFMSKLLSTSCQPNLCQRRI